MPQAEFDAEQEYLKTLSYLSAEDQQRHRDRQGVSFMYQKPPGYDAAMSKAAQQVPETRAKLHVHTAACCTFWQPALLRAQTSA